MQRFLQGEVPDDQWSGARRWQRRRSCRWRWGVCCWLLAKVMKVVGSEVDGAGPAGKYMGAEVTGAGAAYGRDENAGVRLRRGPESAPEKFFAGKSLKVNRFSIFSRMAAETRRPKQESRS